MFDKKIILGVGFTDESAKDILEYLEKIVIKKEKKYFFVSPNPELLVLADKNLEYKKILNSADLALIDGIGIKLAGKLLQNPLENRIAGVDFIESVCKHVAEKPITVGFLGGGPGVAERTAKCLSQKYPGLKVAFFAQELEGDSLKIPVDILFVAFGSPKQEIWLSDNLKRLPITVGMGVGGAFDMISGKIGRAPRFLSNSGMEWLFRLMIQPWRIKRQLRLITFMKLVLTEKFSRNY